MLDSTDDVNLKKELEDILFNVDKYNDLSKVILKPIKSDNEQYLRLMNNDYDLINKASNIFKNYEYLKKLINSLIKEGFSCKDILSGIKLLNSAVIILDEK